MILADLLAHFVLMILALIFLGLAFAFRGMWWWSIISGLLWILFGISNISLVTQYFPFQRELAVVWIVIGIAIFWMPAWYKQKGQQKTLQEIAAEADGEDVDDDEKLEREVSKLRQARWKERRGIHNERY